METAESSSWWSRPAGAREVLALALPLIVSTMSWTIMNFVDRMFLHWYQPEAMGAAMIAGMLHFSMICLPMGVAAYVNTFVAQYSGAGQDDKIGHAVWQAAWIGLAVTPLFLLSIPIAPWLFAWAGHTGPVAQYETEYFQAMAYGGGATVLSAGLSAFFTGRGQMRIVMVVDSLAALLNVGLDWLWIFGYAGFPEWGVGGAAWATVVALWAKVAVYWWLIESRRYRERFQTRAGRRFDAELMRRLIRFGFPSGLQMFVDVSAFTVFLMLIGRLGQHAIVTTTLAFNVNTVAFMPMMGMGIAITTMVGNRLGANEPDLAARATWTSLAIAFAYMGTLALSYVLVPDLFLMFYAAGADPAAFPAIRATTIVLLRFVAAYCLFDAMTVVFVSAIKGAGDTRFILFTTFITAPLPVLIAWIGMEYYGGGLMWSWWVITGWICTLGIIYLCRFLQGRWRTMRVIDADPLAIDEEASPAAEEVGVV